MKILFNNDDYTLYLPYNFTDVDIKDYVKKKVIKLKNKMKRYISGYYMVYVYLNKSYGMIIDLVKEGDFDFFKDFVELDIKIYENSDMYFKFKDYFVILNKNNIYYHDDYYYVDILKLNKKELLKILEFGEIIYGEKLDRVLNKLTKIEFLI